MFATLHSKAALLLAEEALPAAAPEGDGVLGSGLQAMNRVATVVGTALDSFVEVRGRVLFRFQAPVRWGYADSAQTQGGLDSLGVKHALPAPSPVGAPPPPAAAPASAASAWGGYEIDHMAKGPLPVLVK